jgi:hypothetical protein
MMCQRLLCNVPDAGFAWILLLVCAYIYNLARREFWSTVMRALSRTRMCDIRDR